MEAFSDGVIAIIITIMVLELKVPHGGQDLKALVPLIPVFMSYILSFVYVGIYWNNHHHMLQAAKSVNGRILWANLHLLFWLSLIPFVTAWMGENHFSQWPIICYGFVLVMNAFAYSILSNSLINHEGENSNLSKAIGRGSKGMISVGLYLTAIALSWINPWISFSLYVLVAIIWFIPDSRIEKSMAQDQ